MGICSDDELELELNRINNPVQPEIVDMPKKGRGEGNRNTPPELRKVIGETHLEDGRKSALELAAQFGVKKDAVGSYANGATSAATYNQPNKDLSQHLDKKKVSIISKATDKLLDSINSITKEKLDNCRAVEASAVARNLAGIVKDLEPEGNSFDKNMVPNQQIIFYSPQFRREETMETIVVNE